MDLIWNDGKRRGKGRGDMEALEGRSQREQVESHMSRRRKQTNDKRQGVKERNSYADILMYCTDGKNCTLYRSRDGRKTRRARGVTMRSKSHPHQHQVNTGMAQARASASAYFHACPRSR